MPDLIGDTSPLQYLYQLELWHILPALAERVLIPPAVIEELVAGLALGVSLPDVETLNWMTVRRPLGEIAVAMR